MQTNQIETIDTQIVSAVAAEMRKGSLRRVQFPWLTFNAFDRRMDHFMTGGTKRVGLPAALKRFVKEHFPDYIFAEAIGDEIKFRRRLSDELSLHLTFDRIHLQGLGKTYRVIVGVEVTVATRRTWTSNDLLNFFGRANLHWAYHSAEDLEACLSETRTLLKLVLPEYEARWTVLTADEARDDYFRCLPVQKRSFYEASSLAFSCIASNLRSFTRIDRAGQDVRLDNLIAEPPYRKLPEDGWWIKIADDEFHRELVVRVPDAGAPVFHMLTLPFRKPMDGVSHANTEQFNENEALAVPIELVQSPAENFAATPWEEFIDSVEVLSLGLRNGGDKFGAEDPFRYAHLALVNGPPRDLWSCSFSVLGQDWEQRLIIYLDPRSGALIPE